jgi:hypothetical protein
MKLSFNPEQLKNIQYYLTVNFHEYDQKKQRLQRKYDRMEQENAPECEQLDLLLLIQEAQHHAEELNQLILMIDEQSRKNAT